SLNSNDRYGEAGARIGLAVLARREGELKEGTDLIRRGVEIVESVRTEDDDSPRKKNDDERLNRLRIDYFAQMQEFYEVYIDLLMRLDGVEPGAGHAAEALYVSERARARNLLDLLARAGASDADLGAARPLRVDEIQRRLVAGKTGLPRNAARAPPAAPKDRTLLS